VARRARGDEPPGEQTAASVPPRARPGGTLTVLGCDGSYPGPGGAASGYLVKGDGLTLWLDAGAGTFANLQLVADPATVDAVVLSHEHPDHWSDIDSFAIWLRGAARTAPVPIYAPGGLRARAYCADDPIFDWREVEASCRLTLRAREGGQGLTCTFSATDHGPPTMAVRLDLLSRAGEPSGALAYSADTGPAWSSESLGLGIGTLLCEATYTRELEGTAQHLSGRQAGEMAAAAGVGTLVVTHRLPKIPAAALLAEADEAFGRRVHQAAIGKVLEW